MGRVRRMVRWVVVGRRDGSRASLRKTLGCFTWLDAPARVDRTTPRDLERDSPYGTTPAAPAPIPPPQAISPDWIRLVRVDEIPVGTVTEVSAGEQTIALANVDGQLYAVDSVCPHAGGPLGEGQLSGCTLTCPWHGWSYDVRTGRGTVDGDVILATHPVVVVDGIAYLSTPIASTREQLSEVQPGRAPE